jgi:hypothetical protein
MSDLIDKYQQAGLISDPRRFFRPCECCGEMFHPDDLNTVDVDRCGEHWTIDVCDECKDGNTVPNVI